FDRLDIKQNTEDVLRAVEEIAQPLIDKKTGGIQSLETVKQMAEEYGEDGFAVVKDLSELQKTVPNIGVKLVAGRILRNTVAADLHKSVQEFAVAASGEADNQLANVAELSQRVLDKAEFLLQLDTMLAGVTKEVARG